MRKRERERERYQNRATFKIKEKEREKEKGGAEKITRINTKREKEKSAMQKEKNAYNDFNFLKNTTFDSNKMGANDEYSFFEKANNDIHTMGARLGNSRLTNQASGERKIHHDFSLYDVKVDIDNSINRSGPPASTKETIKRTKKLHYEIDEMLQKHFHSSYHNKKEEQTKKKYYEEFMKILGKKN